MRSLNPGDSNPGMRESRAHVFLPPRSPSLSQVPLDFLPGLSHLATQVTLCCGSQKGVSSMLVTFRGKRNLPTYRPGDQLISCTRTKKLRVEKLKYLLYNFLLKKYMHIGENDCPGYLSRVCCDTLTRTGLHCTGGGQCVRRRGYGYLLDW